MTGGVEGGREKRVQREGEAGCSEDGLCHVESDPVDFAQLDLHEAGPSHTRLL